MLAMQLALLQLQIQTGLTSWAKYAWKICQCSGRQGLCSKRQTSSYTSPPHHPIIILQTLDPWISWENRTIHRWSKQNVIPDHSNTSNTDGLLTATPILIFFCGLGSSSSVIYTIYSQVEVLPSNSREAALKMGFSLPEIPSQAEHSSRRSPSSTLVGDR